MKPRNRRPTAAVDLYWLPLGAGGHYVRLNGRIYEALAARLQRRPAFDLYHSALEIQVGGDTFVVVVVARLSEHDSEQGRSFERELHVGDGHAGELLGGRGRWMRRGQPFGELSVPDGGDR